MSTAVTVPQLPELPTAPGDGLVPIWADGKLQSARVDSIASSVVSVTSFGASVDNSGGVNDVALALAVSTAIAEGHELYWPDLYPSTGSIAGLHSVRHRGPGGIVRGSDTFYVEPKYGQTNRLYVSTSGSSSNDGVTSSQPMTLTQAAATLRNYGPVLGGVWRIILAAGTYSSDRNVTFDTASRDWLIVQGPSVGGHPNVPAAIIDGTGAGANTHAFIVGVGGSPAGVTVWFQDIKTQNFNAGTQNSCGWSQGYGARCIYVNCHADNCDFAGILADQGDICLVKGGIIDGCRDGIVLNATKGTVGYSSPFAPGGNTIVRNCTEFGVYWSRGAQGHIDNCLLDNNARSVRIESSARAHILGTDFRRATVAAISTNTDGSYYDDISEPNIYNDGTGNANARRYEHNAYSGPQQGWLGSAFSEMCIYAENPGSSLTSATKAQIGSDLQMPNGVYAGQSGQLRPYYFIDKKTKIRIRIWGDTPNAAASFGVDFWDGTTTSVMAYSSFVGTPAAGGFEYELTVSPLTQSTQRGYVHLIGSTGTPRLESGGSTADMGLPQTIRLMAQSASGSMVVRRVEVWVGG